MSPAIVSVSQCPGCAELVNLAQFRSDAAMAVLHISYLLNTFRGTHPINLLAKEQSISFLYFFLSRKNSVFVRWPFASTLHALKTRGWKQEQLLDSGSQRLVVCYGAIYQIEAAVKCG